MEGFFRIHEKKHYYLFENLKFDNYYLKLNKQIDILVAQNDIKNTL